MPFFNLFLSHGALQFHLLAPSPRLLVATQKKSEHIFNFILQWCCRPSLLPVTAPLLLCDRLCCWRRRRHRRRQRRRRTQHNYHNFAYSASSEKLVTPPCPLSQCMAHNYEPAEQQQHTATTVATVRSATIRS